MRLGLSILQSQVAVGDTRAFRQIFDALSQGQSQNSPRLHIL